MTAHPIDRLPTRSYADCIGWIDAQVAALAPEELAVSDTLRRVLARDEVAARDFPPVDRVTIDGVALQSADTIGASAYNPLTFRISDRDDQVLPGTAIQVRAGDSLPAGADAVAPLEFAQPGVPGTIDVIEAVPAEHEVERKAGHFTHSTVLLRAGRCLRAADLGLLAAGGLDRIAVIRQPRIAVAVREGDASDVTMLRALIERDGGTVVATERIARTPAAIRQAIAAAGADVVLVVGGPERGRDRDAAAAFSDAGKLEIAEIAVSPGGSVAIGCLTAGWAFSLPASLASSFWAYEAVVGRAVRRLAGRPSALPLQRRDMTLARKIVSTIGVTEFCGVRCRDDGTAEPLSRYARSNPRAVIEADGFVIVAEGSEGMPAGATAQVHLFGFGAQD